MTLPALDIEISVRGLVELHDLLYLKQKERNKCICTLRVSCRCRALSVIRFTQLSLKLCFRERRIALCLIQITKGRVQMKLNVGGIDKILRVILGVALIAAAATGALPVWGYIGIVPLVTGLVNFCPLYTVLGFSSRKG